MSVEGRDTDIPMIISVDDHVVEPPDLWTSRLPARYRDVGPRVERDKARFSFTGGVFSYEKGVEDGEWCDWWIYDDLVYPFPKLSAAVGFDDLDVTPTTYDEIRPGCWKQADRLADMTANHVEASICFPNTLPRFCGQTFYEQGVKREGGDPELARLCIEAYNDWMVEEWCGDSGGRLIPLCLVPLWDVEAAVAEVRRNAERGVRAVAFSELPTYLGLPSFYSGEWDPFFAACQETGTVLCMHIGSGTKTPKASPDSPDAVAATILVGNSINSLTDWLFSGVLHRFPELKLLFAEAQIGWIPYVLQRADDVWETHRGWADSQRHCPELPSTYYYRQITSCFFKDPVGIELLDKVGEANVVFETDYPHQDGTWPHSREAAARQFGHLEQRVIDRIARGNAIELFGLDLPARSGGDR